MYVWKTLHCKKYIATLSHDGSIANISSKALSACFQFINHELWKFGPRNMLNPRKTRHRLHGIYDVEYVLEKGSFDTPKPNILVVVVCLSVSDVF